MGIGLNILEMASISVKRVNYVGNSLNMGKRFKYVKNCFLCVVSGLDIL